MSFSARLTDAFAIPGKGMVLQSIDVAGEPEAGESFVCHMAAGRDRRGQVVAAVRDIGSGQVVATCSCLTGKPTRPYAMIMVDWPEDTFPTKTDLPARIESEAT